MSPAPLTANRPPNKRYGAFRIGHHIAAIADETQQFTRGAGAFHPHRARNLAMPRPAHHRLSRDPSNGRAPCLSHVFILLKILHGPPIALPPFREPIGCKAAASAARAGQEDADFSFTLQRWWGRACPIESAYSPRRASSATHRVNSGAVGRMMKIRTK